jgi:type IV secretion system protein VirB6
MNGACPLLPIDVGVIRELLTATRCNVGAFSQAGFSALTGPHSIFPIAVTGLLIIYVAILGYRLMLGYGALTLSDMPLVGLKIGTILALTLNWNVFQTLVLDICTKAPIELASAIVGPQTSPLDRLQTTYDELRADQAAFAKLAQSNPLGDRSDDAEASDKLAYASTALLAATGGTLALATVVTGVLASVGPIFAALLLFESAGGLFAGWVRATAASALVPMLCWITIVILLAAIEPQIVALAAQRSASTLDAPTATLTATIIFVFAAAQLGLVVAAAIVACGFRLPTGFRRSGSQQERQTTLSYTRADQTDARIQNLVHALHRYSPVRDASTARTTFASTTDTVGAPSTSVESAAQSRPVRLGESYRRMSGGLERRQSRDVQR